MTKRPWFAMAATVVLGAAVAAGSPATEGSAAPWSMKATIIEACSCPMFCQCYFNTKPAAHGGHHGSAGEHFCRFNNVFRVDKGRYGDTKLDGAKFWVAGDLGGDFSKGKMDWAVLHFDPSVTPQQREGIQTILGHLYPVQWNSFGVGNDLAIEWTGGKDRAVARLDGGKAAEVVLQRPSQGMTAAPVMIQNLKYWGAPRNDGFVLMPNEVEAYRLGDKPFEFKGTNGFMITFDIASADVAAGTH
jgi:hypothetical protein